MMQVIIGDDWLGIVSTLLILPYYSLCMCIGRGQTYDRTDRPCTVLHGHGQCGLEFHAGDQCFKTKVTLPVRSSCFCHSFLQYLVMSHR